MGRRATATVGLTALAAAVVLLIAMTADRTPVSSAGQEPEQTHQVAPTPAPTLDASQAADRARHLARLAKQAKAQARLVKLFQDNRCWKDEAPAGVVPSHAVVTLPGALPSLVSADVGYGIWLDGDPGELHGFCP